MTLKELRIALLSRIGQLLEPLGYVQRDQSFRRDEGAARLSLHIAFINHVTDCDVTADVAVRHHAVEDLLNAMRPLLSAREKRETATVGAELGNLAGVGQRRWKITAPTDIEPSAESIRECFLRIGEPFLLRFSEPGETLRVLEDDGPEARLICPLPDRRSQIRDALRALVQQRPA